MVLSSASHTGRRSWPNPGASASGGTFCVVHQPIAPLQSVQRWRVGPAVMAPQPFPHLAVVLRQLPQR